MKELQEKLGKAQGELREAKDQMAKDAKLK